VARLSLPFGTGDRCVLRMKWSCSPETVVTPRRLTRQAETEVSQPIEMLIDHASHNTHPILAGVSGVYIVRAGGLVANRSVAITSGAGGRGANGGMAGPSFLIAVRHFLVHSLSGNNSQQHTQSESEPTGDTTDEVVVNKRSNPLTLQIAKNLKLTSKSGGNGFNGYGTNVAL
jgi:hypothetical protein